MASLISEVNDLVRWAYRQPRNIISRRIEICESDGATLWEPAANTKRLIDGSMSFSYDRDERRQLSGLTLANDDGVLDYSPNGFWYDKVIKVYRGIKFTSSNVDYEYEAQVGEFMIDKLNAPKFPHTIEITGRDYTKRLMNDKFSDAISFDDNQTINEVVRAIAFSGGITKFRLAMDISNVLGSVMTFDKYTTRWDAIKKIVQPFGIDAYFSADGYLVTEYASDVSTTIPTITFGAEDDTDGSIEVSRSVTDSGIYNDLVVRSSNSNSELSGIAPISRWQNTDVNSPTSIQKLGRRSTSYESELLITQADTDNYLQNWKSIAALETWEMAFGFRFLPWIEVGKVIQMTDSNSNIPSRYLLTDITAPIGIGSVSGTGKRLTIVG